MPLRLRVTPRTDQKADEGEVAAAERIVEFEDSVDEVRIGRRADAELSLPFKALSSLHARLLRKRTSTGERGNAWLIEDLESKNGTYVGKNRLKPGEQRLMFAGDRIDLGPVKVVFDGHTQPTPGAEGTGTIARRLVNDLLLASPGSGAPTLSVIAGAKDVQTLKLLDRDRPYFIGRAQECDLAFPYDELSRKHASLTRTWNGIVLRDLGSKNGILVNGIAITSQRLCDGDEIEMGPLKLRLMDPEEKYLRSLEDKKEERAPRTDSAPKPQIDWPAALAVSVPPTPAAPPIAGSPGASDASTGARKASRLAPRPAAPGAAAPASVVQAPSIFDEHHPALSARRPPADPQPEVGHEQTEVRRAKKTMYFAAVVLLAILAAVVYLTLGNGSTLGSSL
jgi:pSer/pThr/pTyr-binding forkhead associated (FHA) protein